MIYYLRIMHLKIFFLNNILSNLTYILIEYEVLEYDKSKSIEKNIFGNFAFSRCLITN